VPFDHRGTALLGTAIVYLIAATIPCPPSTHPDRTERRADHAVNSKGAPGSPDHARAHRGSDGPHWASSHRASHEQAADGGDDDHRVSRQPGDDGSFLTAPCPCGCGERSGSAPASKRLEMILLSASEPGFVPPALHGIYPPLQRPPLPPLHLPEPVPIAV
jgi:hypothetical protein